MRPKRNLEGLRRTIYYHNAYPKIIEAVVTNNLGYLDGSQAGKELNDKYLADLKFHLSDMEEKKVLFDWDKGEKRLPLIAKIGVYCLEIA